MTEDELLQCLARGEDSRHQFKQDASNADGLAAELVALANSGGGQLFLGVDDTGRVSGLNATDVRRINQLLSNAASQHVHPPVHPTTGNIQCAQGLVLVVTVADGISKPYTDNQGRIWVKNGADKRHVTAREEMQRLFQQSGLIYADVVPVAGTSAKEADEKSFAAYFNRRYGPSSKFAGQPLTQQLRNLGLANGTELNLSGLMLFGQRPQRFRPAFEVKAVAMPGTTLSDTRYLDSEDIAGTLAEQYQRSFAFIKRNLRHIQAGRGFNTLGQLEIPEAVIEELLVNALIHRDYFTSASIRLFVFADRVEIISPGHLSDSLSTDAIRHGATNRRNPTLTEHAVHILPYRGLGTGIPRALDAWPKIDLLDERDANQFRAVIWRPNADQATPQVTPQVAPQVTPQVRALILTVSGEMSRQELMAALDLSDRKHFVAAYLQPALAAGLLEMTLPDKPQSSKQRYVLTEAGMQLKLLHETRNDAQPGGKDNGY